MGDERQRRELGTSAAAAATLGAMMSMVKGLVIGDAMRS